jgi:hypothetical protein
VWVNHEDATNRFRGVDPGGRYEGLTINDAARMRGDTYSEEWVSTSPLLQCRPRGPTYQPYALDPVQIDKQLDPISRQIVAYRITVHKTAGARMVWLDDRPRPSQYAAHSWEGVSAGTFKGPILEISTSHLKESILTRNGIPSSFRATVIEQLYLDEPYLHWVFTVIDPDYLTEPLVRSGLYVRAPTQQLPPYPCQAEDNLPPGARGSYTVPHYLPGENPWLTETAFKFKAPLTAWRGFAEACAARSAGYRAQTGLQRRIHTRGRTGGCTAGARARHRRRGGVARRRQRLSDRRCGRQHCRVDWR